VKLLAIESSCDETSAALIDDGRIVSNIISSQVALHAQYGGVVPELATREHLKNLPIVVRQALKQADVRPEQLDAIAATRGPGLPGALLVGLKSAQAMAFALKKPFIGIHHHEAHLYSAWISHSETESYPTIHIENFEPSVALIVSGGHTLLVHVTEPLRQTVLGGTLDDAAGECFDKTAKLLGLAYPGGPIMGKLAKNGDSSSIPFPRPMLHDKSFDFSFSGLKTAVRYYIRDHQNIHSEPLAINNLCASVQSAIVDILVGKALQAVKAKGVHCLTVAGGVTNNLHLREVLTMACQRRRIKLKLASGEFCSDNAGMIGALAWLKLTKGWPTDSLDIETKPQWEIDDI